MRHLARLLPQQITEDLDQLTLRVDRQELNERAENPVILSLLNDLMNEAASNWGFDGIFYVAEACPFRLDRNIDPHTDGDYLRRYGYQHEAILLITGSDYGAGYKPDDGMSNRLYCHNWGLSDHLERGDVIQFDASLPHAMMVSGEVRGFSLWLRQTA